MFHHAMPRLNERGAQRFLLEVLQENEPAIKAYRRVGVRITRELDYHPSWEVSLYAVARIPDQVVALGAFAGSELVGTVVYYPLLGWLVNLVVRRDWRRRGVGSALLGSLCPRLPEGADRVLLPNVERGQGGSADFFAACGLDLEVSQYEMALDLGK